MGSRPITFLWLWPATDHEPHCRHMAINKIWRWTESTPRSGWWCSHMAGIYSDCSTRKIIKELPASLLMATDGFNGKEISSSTPWCVCYCVWVLFVDVACVLRPSSWRWRPHLAVLVRPRCDECSPLGGLWPTVCTPRNWSRSELPVGNQLFSLPNTRKR